MVTDPRFGLRMLSKTPSATAMVFIALSLGIGLSVMFSLIDGAVLSELDAVGAYEMSMVSTRSLDRRDDWFLRALPHLARGGTGVRYAAQR